MKQNTPNVLVAWIGKNDLESMKWEKEPGAICQAVQSRRFDLVYLLCNYPEEQGLQYKEWLNRKAPVKVEVHRVDRTIMHDPRDFANVYKYAREAIQAVCRIYKDKSVHLVYHTTPGTSAMSAVWIILAKTSDPAEAELIQTSKEKGLETVSFPFDLSAEFLPTQQLYKLAQGLPPETPHFKNIIHRCDVMKRKILQASTFADCDFPVLIEGETGTGKELFARAIHSASRRNKMLFRALNCGAIPENLLESELFGHEEGAFTGAAKQKKGVFEHANGGTVFLDEIGEMSAKAQIGLLRVLQEKELYRVSGTHLIKVDVRIIAATNKTLVEEIQARRFRDDLFFRLCVCRLELPPLRDRKGDLSALIDYCMDDIAKTEKHFAAKELSSGARNLLLKHSWPGNIRELYSTLCRAMINPTKVIQPEDIEEALIKAVNKDKVLDLPLGDNFSLPKHLDDVARHCIQQALSKSGGNKSKAARLVGISRQCFDNRIDRLEIKLPSNDM